MKNISSNQLDFINNFWLQLGDTSKLDLRGPLKDGIFKSEEEEIPSVLLDVMTNPNYLSFVAKEIMNTEMLPFQGLIMKELWLRPFPMLIATRGCGKTFILALYGMLRAFLQQGVRIVLVGAAFRQSKLIFEYMAEIWNRSPLLRDICGTGREQGPKFDIDRCVMTIGASKIVAIPLGNGEKIRGLRANYIICDEFASINKEVFENVVRGFAAVSANPVEAVKAEYREKAKRFLNIGEQPKESEIYMGNQTIISGTAYFGFNHFHDYWERNKKIINSRGDTRKLEQLFPDGIDKNFDYRDYSIIRLPYNLLPDKFMDMKQIAHARANIHKAYFNMEYGAIFARDTDGFYKRSVIEKCVAKEENNIIMPITGLAKFSVTNRGKQNSKYVIGIDPASERDNFSIIVLELLADHVRIVHCWTSTRRVHSEYIKAGLTQENDFYSFCARKIRDLRTIFPCDCIGIDGQGGGVAIEEALKDKDKIKANEAMILPAIDPNKSRPTDDLSGEHILHVFQAADSEWLSTANHNLRKDLEDRLLLFPEFDTVTLGFAIEDDKLSQRKYDTLEDCMLEIEELKDELASIVHGSTNAGRDTFTTPEEKLPGGKKGRQRKDRYSALLIANYLARNISRAKPKVEYEPYGGFVGTLGKADGGSAKFSGPDWFVQGAKKYY